MQITENMTPYGRRRRYDGGAADLQYSVYLDAELNWPKLPTTRGHGPLLKRLAGYLARVLFEALVSILIR